MSISEDKIAKLRAFGYSNVEARFLCPVAAPSGYFEPLACIGVPAVPIGARR